MNIYHNAYIYPSVILLSYDFLNSNIINYLIWGLLQISKLIFLSQILFINQDTNHFVYLAKAIGNQ